VAGGARPSRPGAYGGGCLALVYWLVASWARRHKPKAALHGRSRPRGTSQLHPPLAVTDVATSARHRPLPQPRFQRPFPSATSLHGFCMTSGPHYVVVPRITEEFVRGPVEGNDQIATREPHHRLPFPSRLASKPPPPLSLSPSPSSRPRRLARQRQEAVRPSRRAWRRRQIRGRSRRPRTISSRGRASSRPEHTASAWPRALPRRRMSPARWGPPRTAIAARRPSPTAGEPPMATARAGSSSSGPSSWATCATPPTASVRPCLRPASAQGEGSRARDHHAASGSPRAADGPASGRGGQAVEAAGGHAAASGRADVVVAGGGA
jgi:hypothetical protein